MEHFCHILLRSYSFSYSTRTGVEHVQKNHWKNLEEKNRPAEEVVRSRIKTERT